MTALNKTTFQQGFSLVELSVVLSLIGVITGILLSVATSKIQADRIRETEEKMEKIEEAFAAYLSQNQRIPCPADPSLASSSTSFGIAARNATTLHSCDNKPSAWWWDAGFPYIQFGDIPTRTLNISDDYAFDAWGRRIMYIMTEKCNANVSEDATLNFSSDTWCGSGTTGITIKDASGSTITTSAVLVLISYGANGHGAYIHAGSTTRFNYYDGSVVDADEQDNSNLLTNGLMQTESGTFVQKARTETFDDIVRYKTKTQLMKAAGTLRPDSTSTSTVSSICNIVNASTGQIPNDAAANTICGTNPGDSTNCYPYLRDLATKVRSLCF